MQSKRNRELVPTARQLRRAMTKEERHLWYDFLRTYPVHFTRQRVIGRFIVDFYCARAKIAVEVDGAQHYDAENAAYDAERTTILQGYGIRVCRIPNNAVNQDFASVCTYIDEVVKDVLCDK